MVSVMSIRFANPWIATYLKAWQTRTLAFAFHRIEFAQMLALTASRVSITLVRRFIPNWRPVGDDSCDWSLSCFHFSCFSESFGWWGDFRSGWDNCSISRGFRLFCGGWCDCRWDFGGGNFGGGGGRFFSSVFFGCINSFCGWSLSCRDFFGGNHFFGGGLECCRLECCRLECCWFLSCGCCRGYCCGDFVASFMQVGSKKSPNKI